jgi:hypothetical protein
MLILSWKNAFLDLDAIILDSAGSGFTTLVTIRNRENKKPDPEVIDQISVRRRREDRAASQAVLWSRIRIHSDKKLRDLLSGAGSKYENNIGSSPGTYNEKNHVHLLRANLAQSINHAFVTLSNWISRILDYSVGTF